MARGKVGDKLHYCISPVIDFLKTNRGRYVPEKRKGGNYAKLYQWIPGFRAFYSALSFEDRREYETKTIVNRGFNADAYDRSEKYYYVEINKENRDRVKEYFETKIWRECNRSEEYDEQAKECLKYVKRQYDELKTKEDASAKRFLGETKGPLTKIFENISAENFYELILYCQFHENAPTASEDVISYHDHKAKNNVYIATKAEIEASFPIEERLRGAKKIIICNYAGSSLLIGKGLSADYAETWMISFLNLIAQNGCDISMVLTDPNSSAAHDAEEYKMRPMEIRTKLNIDSGAPKDPLSTIIRKNIRHLSYIGDTMPIVRDKLHLYITDVALPCAYFLCEFDDVEKNHIKIDIYTPNSSKYSAPNYDGTENVYKLINPNRYDGNARISFIVWEKSPNPSQSTEELYRNIRESILDIVENMSKPCPPEEWDKIGQEKEDRGFLMNKNLDSNLCRRTIKNVLLMSRDKIHNLYSLDERFHISDGAYKQIEHMRIMNLASNLIINPEIGDERHIASDKMKISEIIEKIMTETHAKIDLILEDPERMCERDVEAKIANTRSGSLIGSIWSSWSDIYRKITNENDIYYKRFQEKPRLLDFYSMKIEMPFSIMNVEFSGTECQFNHVKVDLYSALLHNEDDRRSFIIWQKTDPDNYDFFTNNFDEIMKNSDLCRRVTMLMLQNWDNCWKNISST